jgi:hypothetical protein
MAWEKPSGDVPKDHEYGPGSEDRPKGKRGYSSSRNSRTSHLKSIKKWANKKRRQMDKDAKDGIGDMTSQERAKRSWAMIASKDYDNKQLIKDGENQDQSPESIEQMQEIYKYNEDRNNHSGNILMLAHAFGTRPEIKAIQGLMKIIKRQGHVTPEQNDLMYNAIHKKYYQELFPQDIPMGIRPVPKEFHGSGIDWEKAGPQEGNEFSGELAKAKIDGKKSFKVDGKTYKVKEALTKLIDNQKTAHEGILHYSDAKGTPKYSEGYKAAKDGVKYDENPYSGAEKLQWSKGHNDWRADELAAKGEPNYGARGQFESEEDGASAEDLVDIITHRIKMNKELMLSLLGDEGPGPLMNAIEDVAGFYSGTTEVGSSDVSAMVDAVKKQLS